jgi:DNA invertase Pin-like site-specific DNA recombinase
MAIVGYARVSSIGQSLDVQLTQQQCTELCRKRQQGVLIKTLMKDFNLSKFSVYRYLAEAEGTQAVQAKE